MGTERGRIRQGRKLSCIVLVEGDLLAVNHRDSLLTFFGDREQIFWIDITTASPAWPARIVNWRVDTSTKVASYHRLLLTRIWGKPQRAVAGNGRAGETFDWVNFSRHLQGELFSGARSLSRQIPKEIDSTVASFPEVLQSTIFCCIPM